MLRSQYSRSCASVGGMGRSLPCWRKVSSRRWRRMTRRCWSESRRRHSSTDRNPATRIWLWNSVSVVNCLRTFWTVCSTWSWTSWSVTWIVVSRSACCTSSSSSIISRTSCTRNSARPAESCGTAVPCACSWATCSSICEATIGRVPTTATMRSRVRDSCAASPVPAGRNGASGAVDRPPTMSASGRHAAGRIAPLTRCGGTPSSRRRPGSAPAPAPASCPAGPRPGARANRPRHAAPAPVVSPR